MVACILFLGTYKSIILIQGVGEALDDQVLSLQMTSALGLDPCQVSYPSLLTGYHKDLSSTR